MTGLRVTPILVSKDFLDPRKIKRAIDNALDGGSLAVKVDFEVTQQTWKNKASFQIERGPNYRAVFTTDKIYTIVTRGARPHVIVPRRTRVLRFMSKFRAKTRPGAIRSNAGMVGGNPIYARRVHHPGHAPRDFDKTIARKWSKEFPAIMQRALDSESAL